MMSKVWEIINNNDEDLAVTKLKELCKQDKEVLEWIDNAYFHFRPPMNSKPTEYPHTRKIYQCFCRVLVDLLPDNNYKRASER